MNAAAKAGLVFVVAYVATLGIATIGSLVIMVVLSPHGCNALGRALMTLLVVTAIEFLASTGVVGIVAWKLPLALMGRLVLTVGYVLAMLATYVVGALVLMMVFNC